MQNQDDLPTPNSIIKGRGATFNPTGRFNSDDRVRVGDGWFENELEGERLRTSVSIEWAKTALTRNNSPDLPFDRSINPYRGCEHGCIYCFARPSHAYQDLSSGLDFESKLFAKPNIADLIHTEIAKKSYQCKPIALGTNTDPYQPIERDLKITRSLIKKLGECKHPFTITTKSDLVLRDLDILAPLAKNNLTAIGISVTSLDHKLSRTLEPRASSPTKRLKAIKTLTEAGIPVVVQYAPVIPAINDMELENILSKAQSYGASSAVYLLIRLPYEVAPLFKNWLETYFPDRKNKVMNLIRSMRKGKENDPNFGTRMRGSGPYADLIENRFQLTCKKLELGHRKYDLDTSLFEKPHSDPSQFSLL